MKIAFLLYPTEKVKTDEDSSFWMMHELSRRGHSVFHFEGRDLFVENGVPCAALRPSKLDPRRGFLPSQPGKPARLDTLDAVFIRREPPFDVQYLYILQTLELLQEKVFLMNNPRGIAMFNEKLSILRFPELVAETLVTDSVAAAASFVRKTGRVVVKPLDQKAGEGIFSIRPSDPNLLPALASATEKGRKRVMVQRFIDTRGLGDKRILLLDGRPIGVFARMPKAPDFRSNLSLGGSMHPTRLEKADERIIAAIAPQLRKNGLYFTGIDVMGKHLIEINVTSPSGIPEVNELYGKKIQGRIADFIEKKVS